MGMKKKTENVHNISGANAEILFSRIVRLAHEAIIVVDEQQKIIIFNEGAERIFGYSAVEVLGKSLNILLPSPQADAHSHHIQEFARSSEISRDMGERLEIAGRRKDGRIFPAEASILKVVENGKMFFGAILQDITEPKEMQNKVVESIKFMETVINSLSSAIVVLDERGGILSVNDAWRNFANEHGASEEVRNPIGTSYLEVCEKAALTGDESAKTAFEGISSVLKGEKKYFTMEYPCNTAVELRWFIMRVLPLKDRYGGIIISHQDITPRKLSDQRLYETQRIAQIGSWELDLISNRLYWSDAIYRIFEIDRSSFEASYEAFLNFVHPDDRETVNRAYLDSVQSKKPYEISHRLLMPDGRIKFLYERGETYYAPDGHPIRSLGMVQDITERKQVEEALLVKDIAMASSISAIALAGLDGRLTYVNKAFLLMWGYDEDENSEVLDMPVLSFWESKEQAEKVVLTLAEKGSWIGEMRGRRRDGTLFDALVSASLVMGKDIQPLMMASFLDITERKLVEKDLLDREKRLQEIVDSAPFGAHIYELINNRLVLIQANQSANNILGMDHGKLLGKTLEDAFPSLTMTELPARFKSTAKYGVPYSIPQLNYGDGDFPGIFEFHAIQTRQDQVTAFFRNITELAKAYDETLVGWSRAMDFRDRETEGHTQRVTDLTVRLARKMGIAEEKIIYIRWGALLHDMGKLGVPDDILLKPGNLREEERAFMKKHPQFAYEMLYPITFLRPALEIPYCHHEKWDGTGYPRGLKGTEIPLSARIFAIVDVWDALLSDRPYRSKWDEERVIEHIRQSSNSHFDPIVVSNFLEMLREEDHQNKSPKI